MVYRAATSRMSLCDNVAQGLGETMTDATIDKQHVEERRRTLRSEVLLTPLLFFGAMMIAADFTAILLRPLRALSIPYPQAMNYAHFIIPGGSALIWLFTVRIWPMASSISSVLFCFMLISLIPIYAEKHVARIPVARWLDSDAAKSFEIRNGFPIYQIGSSDGEFVLIAPENAFRAREELKRLGMVRKDSPAAD